MPTNPGMYKQPSGDNQAVKRVIITELWKEAIVDSYFNDLMGKDANSIVQTKTDLQGKKGDKISFGIRSKLKGVPTVEGQRMKGREESIKKFMCDVVLGRYRHAVKVENGMTKQRDSFDMNQESIDALKEWMTELIDQMCFDELYDSHTNEFYGGDATGLADLAADDEITPSLLLKIRTLARTGNYRNINPLKPVVIKGKKYYKMLCSLGAIDKAIKNPTMQQYLMSAAPKDLQENPLFSGADIVCHGMILEGHERISTGITTGGVNYSRNLLLGAQALTWAWGELPNIVDEDDDYEEETGHCIRVTCGVKKPTFDSKVYNSLVVTTSELVY